MEEKVEVVAKEIVRIASRLSFPKGTSKKCLQEWAESDTLLSCYFSSLNLALNYFSSIVNTARINQSLKF